MKSLADYYFDANAGIRHANAAAEKRAGFGIQGKEIAKDGELALALTYTFGHDHVLAGWIIAAFRGDQAPHSGSRKASYYAPTRLFPVGLRLPRSPGFRHCRRAGAGAA
jgi:hypothetical protein